MHVFACECNCLSADGGYIEHTKLDFLSFISIKQKLVVPCLYLQLLFCKLYLHYNYIFLHVISDVFKLMMDLKKLNFWGSNKVIFIC